MPLQAVAHGGGSSVLAPVGQVRYVGGGGGGGVPRMLLSTHLPRSTGDVRFGYDVTVSRLPWPKMPPRRSATSGGSVTRR